MQNQQKIKKYHQSLGKLHWIEWSLFCDRLDEALQPLRTELLPGNHQPSLPSSPINNNIRSSRKKFFFYGRTTSLRTIKLMRFPKSKRSVQTKVLKHLQRICDQEAKRLSSVVQEFVLYCPLQSTHISNWHIQVIPKDSSRTITSHDNGIWEIPPNITVPSLTLSSSDDNGAIQRRRSAPSELLQRQQLRNITSATTTDPSSLLEATFAARWRHRHPSRNRRMSSSSISSSSSFSSSFPQNHTTNGIPIMTTTNPFVDDPEDTLAMSRDGLMELDRVYDEEWMTAPISVGPETVAVAAVDGHHHRHFQHQHPPVPIPPPAMIS